MKTPTYFDDIVMDQRVLHFFRALALKQPLRVRFAANDQQLDLETLQIEACAQEPYAAAG
jgi:hypothetical protein